MLNKTPKEEDINSSIGSTDHHFCTSLLDSYLMILLLRTRKYHYAIVGTSLTTDRSVKKGQHTTITKAPISTLGVYVAKFFPRI